MAEKVSVRNPNSVGAGVLAEGFEPVALVVAGEVCPAGGGWIGGRRAGDGQRLRPDWRPRCVRAAHRWWRSGDHRRSVLRWRCGVVRAGWWLHPGAGGESSARYGWCRRCRRESGRVDGFCGLWRVRSGAWGSRMYRTGDGPLEPGRSAGYVGRVDEQVKITATASSWVKSKQCLRFEGVEQAAVVTREDHPGDKRLVWAISPVVADSAEIRSQLAERLPAYMVPAAVVSPKALPLTVNGKLDIAGACRRGVSQWRGDVAGHRPRRSRILAASTPMCWGAAGQGGRFVLRPGWDSLSAMQVIAEPSTPLWAGSFIARGG